MGEVYRAATRMNRGVAIKVLPERRLRIRPARAIRAGARLPPSHPNILAILTLERGGAAVTELLEGSTLRERFLLRSPPQSHRSPSNVRGIAAAPNAASSIATSPENIFITNDGVVKILILFAKTAGASRANAGATAVQTQMADRRDRAQHHGFMPERAATDHRTDISLSAPFSRC